MTKLRTRCNKMPPVCNQARRSLPDTSVNRHKLQHGDLICRACGIGRMHLVKGNRKSELASRERCRCDGVQWADTRNSPHDVNTPGCRHYAGRPGPDVPF